jgi:hypothetical protein
MHGGGNVVRSEYDNMEVEAIKGNFARNVTTKTPE